MRQKIEVTPLVGVRPIPNFPKCLGEVELTDDSLKGFTDRVTIEGNFDPQKFYQAFTSHGYRIISSKVEQDSC